MGKLKIVNGRGVANGKVASSNCKIGSAHTLLARILEELEDVFSMAEQQQRGERDERAPTN